MLPLLVVISTVHLEADVPKEGGDYVEVPFTVPAGTVEIQIAHSDGSDSDILDWGVWSPDGFRGWGGGLTDDAVVGVAQSSRGYLAGAITPGTWKVVIGKAQLNTLGHYSIDVTCRDDATLTVLPTAAFDPDQIKAEQRWYKGDFHVHSEQSGDATATFAEITTLAKQEGLDFVVLSDHNTVSQLPLIAALQQSEPDLLLVRGAEVTTYAGHGNAVGLSSYIDHRIGLAGRTVGGILADVAAQGAIFIVNHPALDLGSVCIGCAWRQPDTDWAQVAAIEIMNGRWEVTESLFVTPSLKLWDAQLDEGHHIAAVSGSDDHRAGKGTGQFDTPLGHPTTLVLANGLSEAALLEGVRAGRTIVNLRGPDDPTVDFTLGGATIGDEVEVASAAMHLHIVGGSAGMSAQIWRDGLRLVAMPVDSADWTGYYTDDTVGPHRYRVQLTDENNQRIVITSHIYATITPIVDDGGCCSGASQPSIAALLVLFGLRRRRYTA